ncbi:hypothetical protein GCM10009661_62730 [Catellatospora chokoriensis]|uniref:eCIS core domain-containing protein n=1 Tax=Catellatospora chokoriensis TaxID=310353 RepID=A0A8J3JXN4_9ACTN|nr:hypothetical protein Cch02nite_38180 [Catellatospora chokoriensis]
MAPAKSAKAASPDALVSSPADGISLPEPLRTRMQQRFGFDLSTVSIHARGADAAAAHALGAAAVTVGRHIVFAQGTYAPETATGQRLIAHELTHVVQNARFGAGPPRISAATDTAEREAERLSNSDAGTVREAPTAAVARQSAPATAPPPNRVQENIPPVFAVFANPVAATPAGAPAAFDAYKALAADDKEKALKWAHSTGRLKLVLAALGPVRAAEPKYADIVHGILRWIEETETRKTTGKTDAEMAKVQATFIKAQPSAPPGWGGTTQTRWAGLLPAARRDWADRGLKAIAAMVSYAHGAAPELGLTAGSFELNFDLMDTLSLGSLAAVGSAPGKNVTIGFEFVALVEVDPAYALSTVVHELAGHPMYDEASGASTYSANYAAKLYSAAAAQVPSVADPHGNETFGYWQSEIYSLLKEIPYWRAVLPAHAAKRLDLPGPATTAAATAYDPRSEIPGVLQSIRDNWEPSLVNGLVRGFYQRVANDPSMRRESVTEFENIVRQVFPAADAAVILK